MLLQLLEQMNSYLLAPSTATVSAVARRPGGELPLPRAVPAVPALHTGKPMRSPEQVRADLVRLRASAKERHAPVPIPRQTTFDAAVFKDFVVHAEPERTPHSDAAYPKTVFAGRGSSAH
jgi:hypothetical protein